MIEPLEQRRLLSASLINVSNWVAQGPGPINAGGFQQIGAVEELAADPTNANILYAATVNGGIWKTTNATAASPAWTPLTDQFPVLTMSAIAISPLNSNTIYAGTGQRSSGGFDGAAPNGLLRSTDGGASWAMVGQSLAGRPIRSIVPMAIGTSVADQVVLAASTSGGIFRSTDGGVTFTQISGTNGLPNGSASFALRDPANANRVYAAIPASGVFRSDDGGLNWTAANGTGTTSISGALPGSRIELAIHNSVGNNVLYAVVLQTNVAPTDTNFTERVVGVARSLDQGGTWRMVQNMVQPIPNGQGTWHLAFAADPTDPNRFFIDGDVSGGFRVTCNDGNPALDSWENISNAGANGTAPHADSRDMKFDANNNLLEADDGGIYRLNSPNNPAVRTWTPVQGSLHNTEFYSLAYDSLNNVLFGGAQDNGTPGQPGANALGWNLLQGGDGGDVMIDNNQTAHPGQTIRYTSSQNLGGFQRQTFNAANTPVGGATDIPMVVNGTGGRTITGPGTFPNETFEDEDDPDAEEQAPTIFDNSVGFIQQYVINAVDQNRFLIGDSFLYETFNQGNTFDANWGLIDLTNNGVDDDTDGNADPDADEWKPANPLGVRAMAYGGRLGGVDNPDIIYVGAGNQLRLRTAITNHDLTDFPVVASYPGSAVAGIALDPDNWQRGYILDSNNRVWRFTNAGASASDWTNITGNLSGVTGLTSDTRTIALVTPTAAPGDDFVVVGGQGGVFRAAPPASGPTVWNEVGANMPNVIVKALHYDATDDVLLAGTWGRGAFTLPSASSALSLGGILQINGDTDFAGEDDTIELFRNSLNPTLLDVFLNSSTPTLEVPISSITQINVNGLAGKDSLTVDSSFGLISVPNGIRYDGGAQSDSLTLQQTGGPTVTADNYAVGPDSGQGTSAITAGGAIQNVSFDNLEPVIDTVGAANLTITATPEDNAISYATGSVLTNGKVLIDNYESIEFSNKTQVTLDASFGNDHVNLGNGSAPAGLAQFNVLGGDGNDLVLSSAAPNSVQISVNLGAGDDEANLAGVAANITLAGGTGNDVLTSGDGDDSLSGGTGEDILFAGAGINTVDGGGDADTYLVRGAKAADTISISQTASLLTVALNASTGTNTISQMELVRVLAGNGSDTITIHPAAAGGLAYSVFGGEPGGAVGDTLIVDSAVAVTYTVGPENDSGSLVVATVSPTDISFDEIEAISITGGGPLVVNGTNGPDAITLIARDASTHGGADGIQDFTVSVNASSDFLFLNVASLQINALSGGDQIDLIVTAPNNADWATALTVDAGAPSLNDTIIVETPGPGAESASYTPSGADAGTLSIKDSLAGAATSITFFGAEQLLYDGKSDGDALKILGTAGDDTITHAPGSNNDAGALQVNGLLALTYQHLGLGAALGADGGAGSDEFIYTGTAAGDAFVVNAAGDIVLNSHLPVALSDVNVLTLQGLGSDDVFTLVPAISASPYAVMNFTGGESSAGDVVNLAGTGADDDFDVSGTSVSQGGRTVNAAGVETENLSAGGGTDSLHYNGVSGVTEAINVASSSTAGTGRIYVTGLMNLVFTSADFVEVNGNAADTDTLNFLGTSNVDVFTIHSDALGTAASPVLTMAPTSGAAALLTLTNYTGIATLQVSALDGEDVINLFTAPAAVSRSLLIDGGSPTGKKKLTDQLNIFYASPKPKIVQSKTTQSPQSGLVNLDYGTSNTLVQFTDIEDFVIRKA
jgi:hypothetical protein